MNQLRTFDIAQFVDDRRMTWFNARIIILSCLVTIANGFATNSAFFAGPALVKAWAIKSMAVLGPIFSANLAGFFFGAASIGWIGDRFGRKIALLTALATIAVFSFLGAYSHSIGELIAYRFLAGFGMGGVFPTVIALNLEFAPKFFRASAVVIVIMAQTFGSALPALVSLWLLATYGWGSYFWVGGILAVLAAAIAWLWIPESIKYLVLKYGNSTQSVKVLHMLDRSLAIGPETELIISTEKPYAFTPKLLFTEGRAIFTTLIWVMFICNIMTNYFVTGWLPTVLTTAQISVSEAAVAGMLFQIGGALGCLPLGPLLDRKGMYPMLAFFALAAIDIASLGFAAKAGSHGLIMTLAFFAGFLVPGVQAGINTLSGLVYPVAFRANGSGWAFSIGRIGAVAGPIVAGYIIALHAPIEQLFLFPIIPLAIAFVSCAILAPRYDQRYRGGGETGGKVELPTGVTPSHA